MFTFSSKLFIGLIMAFSARDVEAKEGFSTSLSDAPSSVVAAWDATFAILTDAPSKYQIGTAFLVSVDSSTPFKKLYFLTANHLVDVSCETGKLCPSTYLINNVRLLYHFPSAELESATEPRFSEVEVVTRGLNQDLALLRVTVRTYEYEDLKPIALPSNCELKTGETLYSIGFPAAADRTNPSSLPIAEKDIETKRWTQGLFVNFLYDGAGETMKLFTGTTTDSLEGSSGGPIINAAGEAVSVAISSASLPKNGFQYLGREEPGNLDWQTLGARCEVLRGLRDYF